MIDWRDIQVMRDGKEIREGATAERTALLQAFRTGTLPEDVTLIGHGGNLVRRPTEVDWSCWEKPAA